MEYIGGNPYAPFKRKQRGGLADQPSGEDDHYYPSSVAWSSWRTTTRGATSRLLTQQSNVSSETLKFKNPAARSQ